MNQEGMEVKWRVDRAKNQAENVFIISKLWEFSFVFFIITKTSQAGGAIGGRHT